VGGLISSQMFDGVESADDYQ